MYRPTFALSAIGEDDPVKLAIAAEQMQALLDALTACNRSLRRRYRFPSVLNAGIKYDPDRPAKGSVCGDDDWADLSIVFARKKGDCDDLAPARAAELQEMGIKARAIPLLRRTPAGIGRVGKHDYHIVVLWPKGLKSYPPTVYRDPSGSGLLLEDPSRLLGMK